MRQKNSHLQLTIEKDHQAHEQALSMLFKQIDQLIEVQDYSEKILQGNAFYLSYRLFYSEMLKHLYDEEIALLPELQALYTDKELATLQARTYQKMTPKDMLAMLNILFPHANREAMRFFTNKMKEAKPEKFQVVWQGLADNYKKLI